MCSAVYLRNTGISLSNLLSKKTCVGGAFPAHAFHDVVSPMYGPWRPLTWGYDTERPSKGLPLARPQRTEEKGTACTLEKPNLNPVDAFSALLAKILGAETTPQKGCRKGLPAHKGCAERVQKGGSSAERGFQRTKGVQKGCRKGVLAQKGGCTKGAQRVQKGCRKGARTPLPAKRGGVEIPAKPTVSDKSENQPPKEA